MTEVRHVPLPGVRNARYCTECGRRAFDEPEWACPEHGGKKTVRQANHPYMGQSTEPPEGGVRTDSSRRA
jgi:hypothetical protein